MPIVSEEILFRVETTRNMSMGRLFSSQFTLLGFHAAPIRGFFIRVSGLPLSPSPSLREKREEEEKEYERIKAQFAIERRKER